MRSSSKGVVPERAGSLIVFAPISVLVLLSKSVSIIFFPLSFFPSLFDLQLGIKEFQSSFSLFIGPVEGMTLLGPVEGGVLGLLFSLWMVMGDEAWEGRDLEGIIALSAVGGGMPL